MDESQGSDFFADSIVDVSNNSAANFEEDEYNLLVHNMKTALSHYMTGDIDETALSKVLGDIENCINQSLDLVMGILVMSDVQVEDMLEHINNAAGLLQMLADLLGRVVDTMAMSCGSMETLPITAGKIIMTIFRHCKNSESLYGDHLTCVGEQLKNLFKACHALQLVYLMVLGNHFLFDLTARKDQDVLIEALEINLSIGELVQALDVKTMAEQWKGYIVLCEKYSYFLVDKDVYCKTVEQLCAMVEDNVKTATELKQDEKITLRSLKVASFMIKILHKICDIFGNGTQRAHERVLHMLKHLHGMYNGARLDLAGDRSPQFMKLLDDTVFHPSDRLCELHLSKDIFVSVLFSNCVDTLKDDKILGLILLLMSIMRIAIQTNDLSNKALKRVIINCVYNLLPHCHIWFNIGMKFRSSSDRAESTLGLYERVVAHTLSLALTMDTAQFNYLEEVLMQGILSEDLYIGLFSSNLSVCLARVTRRELSLNKVLTLIRIYMNFEQNETFIKSPQYLHLRYTIGEMFRLLESRDKLIVLDKYSIYKDDYSDLWTALKICQLPPSVVDRANTFAAKKFDDLINVTPRLDFVQFDALVKTMKLLATCPVRSNVLVEKNVVTAWSRACVENNPKTVDLLCYYEYVKALALLTTYMETVYRDNTSNFHLILHVISTIVSAGNTEFKLVLMDLLCKMAVCESVRTTDMTDVTFHNTFKEFLQDSDLTVKYRFFYILRMYKNYQNINIRIVPGIANENHRLKNEWQCFLKNGCLSKAVISDQLAMVQEFVYGHKCVIGRSASLVKSNFDLVDIDTLFDEVNDPEPASKKVKLTDDTDNLISTLEAVAKLLSEKKGCLSSEFKSRIRNVADQMLHIVSN